MEDESFNLTKVEKLKFASQIVKAVQIALIGSIFSDSMNNYLLGTLLIGGAISDAILSFIKGRERDLKKQK